MKKQIVIAILTLGVLVFAGGCDIPTSGQIEMATKKTDDLMVVVDELQDTINVLVKEDIIESERINIVLKEVDEAQDDIIKINEAVKEKADEGLVEQLIAANEATAPINPYYPLIASILFAVNELRKRKGYEKGVARLESEAAPEEAKKIHDTVKHYTKRLIP